MIPYSSCFAIFSRPPMFDAEFVVVLEPFSRQSCELDRRAFVSLGSSKMIEPDDRPKATSRNQAILPVKQRKRCN